MDAWLHLAEQRIADAERAGAFADLPGRGKPLALEDLSAVPEELRASYLLLKGAGFVPPELEARKEWLRLQDLLAACAGSEERTHLAAGAQRAALRYRLLLEQRGAGQGWLDYRSELLAHLAQPPEHAGAPDAAPASPRR